MNTDILLGLLSRIVPLRRELYSEQHSSDNQSPSQQVQKKRKKKQTYPPIKTEVQCPLKLVIMSATLRVEVYNEN